jgi:phage shock protein PspC (stress-responsive transcriptional regulator)
MKRYFEVNRIYKDSTHQKVSGVCAGLAKHFSVPRLFVRVVAIVCLITLPTVTAIAYITATLLIPNR